MLSDAIDLAARQPISNVQQIVEAADRVGGLRRYTAAFMCQYICYRRRWGALGRAMFLHFTLSLHMPFVSCVGSILAILRQFLVGVVCVVTQIDLYFCSTCVSCFLLLNFLLSQKGYRKFEIIFLV